MPASLFNKYNIPVPRYTSYPTVPYWKNEFDIEAWKRIFKNEFEKTNRTQGISLYVHLPFCESLCTYCGCNKKITGNHKVENEYMAAVLQEWALYRELMEETPVIKEIHLGGGTPTFFSPANLYALVSSILENAIVHPGRDFSLEGHPNNTTRGHLESLYRLGFRRISYGVQDNDPQVQKIINRLQPFENVKCATETAREAGYQSVNFDLIYGLPLQTPESISRTVNQCITLKPDRVAFYSYAHIPWKSRGQRLFDENDLPSAGQKIELYRTGRDLFTENDYQDIGMDHFALPGDELYKAWQEKTLHRNFMGYTARYSSLLVGLGVSAIGETRKSFAQNCKSLHDYYRRIQNNELAVEKAYFLTPEDEVFRKHILEISCQGETVPHPAYTNVMEAYTFPELEKLRADGLVLFDQNHVQVTPVGRSFIRNICRAFDLHLLRNEQQEKSPVFSKAI